MTTNTYSQTWFQSFMAGYAPAQTEQEVLFLTRVLPHEDYHTILDVCCGTGRHAVPLAEGGYKVTGLDLHESALAEARQRASEQATFIKADMRQLSQVDGTFDAITNMWQSFGYFDPDTNLDVLRQMYAKLNPRGRLVLDIYHKQFFLRHQGTHTFEKDGTTITETKQMHGDRLTVTLNYGARTPPDVFSWQLYTPEEIEELAEQVGFKLRLACSGFWEEEPPSTSVPRMQLIFQKP